MTESKYDRARIIAAVEHARLNRMCEACTRADGWMIPSREGEPDVVEVMATVRGDDPSFGFDFVPMICRHCGSTRFLHLETLIANTEVTEAPYDTTE